MTRKQDCIRVWAFKNALTLTFMSAMFVITWIIIVLANYTSLP